MLHCHVPLRLPLRLAHSRSAASHACVNAPRHGGMDPAAPGMNQVSVLHQP